MIESKSMFARRIGKPIAYVSVMCKRGVFPVDARGFVLTDAALAAYRGRRKVGRPAEKGKRVRVTVYVKAGEIRKIKRIASILGQN